MAKKKRRTGPRSESASKTSQRSEAVAAPNSWYATRETIESIVVAFVLAFLFRTFQAEAFVIPTGSMSPSLMGQHKDVQCTECGYRIRTTASTEGEEYGAMLATANNPRVRADDRARFRRMAESQLVVAGMCPMCRQTVAFREDLGGDVPPFIKLDNTAESKSYPGDRVLVNKYGFGFYEPERWDVVVFKFPGDGSMNYIKRLVGLPGETLQVFQGDLYVQNPQTKAFEITRRPEDVQLALLQPVHDTDYESATLYRAGWPLRWAATDGSGWQVEAEGDEGSLDVAYRVDAKDTTQWLAYRHLIPSQTAWARVFEGETERVAELAEPQLIVDFNDYNARILRGQTTGFSTLTKSRSRVPSWEMEPYRMGTHWVGDLAVECEAEFSEAEGELTLELVEAGQRFRCTIDLAAGTATFGIDGLSGYQPQVQLAGFGPGSHELMFANVDDCLWLWVDGEHIAIDGAEYDGEAVFGGRDNAIPVSTDQDPGDLEPARVGVKGASVTIERLVVLRDIYYLAVSATGANDREVRAEWVEGGYLSEYGSPDTSIELEDGTRLLGVSGLQELFRRPDQWARFKFRGPRRFTIGEDHFFVLGDNSPESQDSRLWLRNRQDKRRGVPGGVYLERGLLTGRALCVFWPHSWGGVPGIPALPGLPNLGDMRIVR